MASQAKTLFVCGYPSSGTDLLKNILNAHPSVYLGGEFPLLPALATQYAALVDADKVNDAVRDIVNCDIYQNLARTELQRDGDRQVLFADIYHALLTTKPVTWVGNKTPQNSENIAQLEHLFPNSFYILIVRDIRDVALSWHRKWGKNPQLCAHKWNYRMQAAKDSLRQLAPDRHLLLSFEALIADHAGVMQQVCSALGLPYDDKIDRFYEHVDDIVAGKINYGKPIVAGNTRKWESAFDEKTVRRIEEIAFQSMHSFDYVPSVATGGREISALELMRGKLVDVWASLFVGNRAQKDNRLAGIWQSISLEIAKRYGKKRHFK